MRCSAETEIHTANRYVFIYKTSLYALGVNQLNCVCVCVAVHQEIKSNFLLFSGNVNGDVFFFFWFFKCSLAFWFGRTWIGGAGRRTCVAQFAIERRCDSACRQNMIYLLLCTTHQLFGSCYGWAWWIRIVHRSNAFLWPLEWWAWPTYFNITPNDNTFHVHMHL